MSLRSTPKLTMVIFLFFSTLLGGCGGGVLVAEKTPGSQSFSGLGPDISRAKPLGFLKFVRLDWNGVDGIPSDPFLVKIRGRFRETNLFQEVVFEKPFTNYPYVEMEVTFKHRENTNVSANAGKSMISALTLGLLAPLFPLEGEYSGELQVNAFRSDGIKKEFHAKSSGTATAYISLKNFQFVWQELIGTVDGNNFNSILTQMVEEADFFKLEDKTKGSVKSVL